MALEVGRITARIDAQVKDFEQKVTGAQKTFETASVKMESAAKRTTATLQKTYQERVVAANKAANEEIAAAARTMRERAKLAGSTAELTAIKKLYADRVAAARAGAQQEIKAAQSAFLSARGPVVGAAGAVDDLAKAAGRAAPGINSIRSAMTALTASALHTAPGVAQVSSVLSAMALGAPATIAILTGIAAITLGWRKMTEQARELKKAAEESSAAIAKLVQNQAAQIGLLKLPEIAALAKVRDDIRKLDEISLQRDLTAKEKKRRADLLLAETAHVENLKVLEQEFTKFKDEEEEKRLKDLEEALRKEQKAFEDAADEFARIWQRLQLKITPFELRARTRLQGAGTVEQFAPRRASLLPDDIKQAILAGMAAAARSAGGAGGGAGDTPTGTSFLKGIFSKFSAKNILSGLATSGISSAIGIATGAISSFADSLFDFSGKAKAAAEAMKKAQQDWSKSLDRFILQLSGTEAEKDLANALETLDQFIVGFEEAFNKGKKLKRPDFKSLDELLAWAQALLESSLSVDPARAKEWLKFIAAIKAMQKELDKTTEAVNETVASLINVPQGFKIALARFNATIGQPVLPPHIPSGPRGGPDVVAGGGAARTTYVFQGGIVVEAADPAEFLRQLEIEIQRKKLRGGATITLDF